RCVVGCTARRVSWSRYVPRVFNLGGLSKRELHVRTVSVAVLRARSLGVTGQCGRSGACLVRRQARLVPRVAPVLPGPVHSSVSRTFPPDLLLLPRRVLQGVLGGSAVVCRR